MNALSPRIRRIPNWPLSQANTRAPRPGTTLTVAAKAGELSFVIASNPPPYACGPRFEMRSCLRDRGATSIRFIRDSGGNVTGLSAGDDRVWDLRFTRVDVRQSPAASK